MIDKIYSEKEILIMESLLKLYAEKIPFHAVKVADIAAAAAIGKGTVYAYFHSKEEIIANAVAYRIGRDLREIDRIIKEADTFEDCSAAVLRRMARCRESHNDIFFLLQPEVFSMPEVASVFTELQNTCRAREKAQIQAYLALGVREGLFPAVIDEDYAALVVISAVTGFYVTLCTKKDSAVEKVMENTYNFLLKALQPLY